MIRIAVFVSGGGTNLQALIDAEKSGLFPNGKLTLVIASNPEAYALKRAELAGIETMVISGRDYGSREEADEALVKACHDHAIDLVVLAGYLSILTPVFVNAYRDRIINVHPALIPSFCGKGFYGLRVHEAALAKGVKVTGATVHLVNEIPDGGRILLQKAVDVLPGDTPEVLQRRVMEEAEWKLVPEAVRMMCEQLEKE